MGLGGVPGRWGLRGHCRWWQQGHPSSRDAVLASQGRCAKEPHVGAPALLWGFWKDLRGGCGPWLHGAFREGTVKEEAPEEGQGASSMSPHAPQGLGSPCQDPSRS